MTCGHSAVYQTDTQQCNDHSKKNSKMSGLFVHESVSSGCTWLLRYGKKKHKTLSAHPLDGKGTLMSIRPREVTKTQQKQIR